MDASGSGIAPESRKTIIANFARWAAATSARRCEVRYTNEKWYEYLDYVSLATLFAITPPVSDFAFREWHQSEVEKLASGAGVPVGWAAKLVNMVLKVHVYIARRGDPSLLGVIHPPVDNLLIRAIKREFPLKGSNRANNQKIRDLCGLGMPISGVTTYAEYSKVIDGLRLVSERRKCTLFEIETLWTGSSQESG